MKIVDLKRIEYIIIATFCGGVSGVFVTAISIYFLCKNDALNHTEVAGVANTFIVFTTLIFIGITVILTSSGFIFMQQFSESKEKMHSVLVEEMKKSIRSGENTAVEFLTAALEHPDARKYMEAAIEEKINTNLKQKSDSARRDVENLAAFIKPYNNE